MAKSSNLPVYNPSMPTPVSHHDLNSKYNRSSKHGILSPKSLSLLCRLAALAITISAVCVVIYSRDFDTHGTSLFKGPSIDAKRLSSSSSSSSTATKPERVLPTANNQQKTEKPNTVARAVDAPTTAKEENVTNTTNTTNAGDSQVLQTCGRWSVDERVRRLGNDTELLALTYNVREMMYFPTIDVLLHVVPKGGTTAQLLWLYRGLSGEIHLDDWDSVKCKTYIQDFTSPCWKNIGMYIHDLPVDKRRAVLSRESTLRVAVQRDPYDRLVSAFKSKFTCERAKFFGDRDLVVDVALLRAQAGDFSGNKKCMSFEEYASVLDKIRRNLGQPGYVSKFRHIDSHIRPALFFFDEVDYDLMLDVNEIRRPAAVREMYERLPHKDKIERAVPLLHTSGEEVLKVPQEVSTTLRAFADVTRTEAIRVCKKTSASVPLRL